MHLKPHSIVALQQMYEGTIESYGNTKNWDKRVENKLNFEVSREVINSACNIPLDTGLFLLLGEGSDIYPLCCSKIDLSEVIIRKF